MSADDAIRPTPEQIAPLSRFERCAFQLVDGVNRNPLTKAATHAMLRRAGAGWVYYCSRKLTHLVGFERLAHLRPDRGVIIAANHRSFFDLYIISCWLFRCCDLMQQIYFPVRAEYFYQRLSGIFVNLVMSGLSMYPPVFREPAKRDFNKYGLKRLIQILEQPGAVVGLHPEGTRGNGPDPYALQRAQPGIGKLIIEAQPVVVPMFINGPENSLARQVSGNFRRDGRPIVIVAGEPMNLARFYQRRNTVRVQKELAEHVLAEIGRLGEREREVRQQLDRQTSDNRAQAQGPLFYPG